MLRKIWQRLSSGTNVQEIKIATPEDLFSPRPKQTRKQLGLKYVSLPVAKEPDLFSPRKSPIDSDFFTLGIPDHVIEHFEQEIDEFCTQIEPTFRKR